MCRNCFKILRHSVIGLLFVCFQGFVNDITAIKSFSQSNTAIDTAQINRMNRKALRYRRVMPDSAKYLAEQALLLSEQKGYQKGKGKAFIALGYAHLVNFTPNDSAQLCMQKGYEIFKEMNDKAAMGLACFGLGYVYSFRGDMEKSLEYSKKSYDYYKSAGNKRGMFNAANSLSYIYKQYKEYDKAFEYIYRAIEYGKDTDDTTLIADGYNSLGNICKDQALFQQAIDNYFKALKLWKSQEDSAGMAIAYGSIGNMYYFQKNYQKALEYHKRKLPIVISREDNWEESKTYNSIAEVYNATGKHQTALVFFNKALQMNSYMNYPVGLAKSYYNLAQTYYLMNKLDSAITYVNMCLEKAKKTDVKAELANYYILRGKIHHALGDEDSAKKDILTGYNLGKNLNLPFSLSDATDMLNKIYASRGAYDKAYHYLKEYKSLQDSINKEANIKKLTRREIQYEFNQKEKQLETEKARELATYEKEVRKQRIYLFLVVGIAVLIVIITVFFIKHRNTKAKYQTIALEQKLLRTQMDPHFIFNSLCAIEEYIMESKPREAAHFLSKFAGLMRSIFENSKNEFVSLEDEVKTLKDYLEIQKLRFDTDFNYSIVINPPIDAETYSIPPMLVQPFVENSVQHGLLPKEEKGEIEVVYALNNGMISIDVKDNGIGYKQSLNIKKHPQKKRRFISSLVTKERIDYLKKTLNRNSRFEVIDLEEHGKTGTWVHIEIPYRITIG